MASFTDTVLGLHMDVPVGWEAQRTEQFTLILFAPAQDGYRANLGVNEGRLDPPTPDNLKKLIVDSEAEQQSTYNQYRTLSRRDVTIDGHTAHIRHYEWSDTGTGLTFSQLQAFILVEPHLYVIDGSSLKQHADSFIPQLEQIVTSIRVLPEPATETAPAQTGA